MKSLKTPFFFASMTLHYPTLYLFFFYIIELIQLCLAKDLETGDWRKDSCHAHVQNAALPNFKGVNVSSNTSELSSKPRRWWQRERHQTRDLMSKTIAMHVRYKSLYISLPSSAKQQREMIKVCVFLRTRTTTNGSFFRFSIRNWTLSLHIFLGTLAWPLDLDNANFAGKM